MDTIQDGGRCGYASLGIPPSGPMDWFSAFLANAILGKELTEAVIEIHFPAPVIEITKACILSVAGADFAPTVNGVPVPLCQPVFINKGEVLAFGKPVSGARAYIGVYPGIQLIPWLGSNSTNTKAKAGGLSGKPLGTGGEIGRTAVLPGFKKTSGTLPWNCRQLFGDEAIRVIPGPEWHYLDDISKQTFQRETFLVNHHSDRMGARLKGKPLNVSQKTELLSSAVSAGTIQLLPDGNPVVLMADHPTTGGYPRIAAVISADLGRLAQLLPGSPVRFSITDIKEAEELYLAQYGYLEQVKCLSRAEMERFLK